MNEPCIVARELMDSHVFTQSIGIRQFASEAFEAGRGPERFARRDVERVLERCVRQAIERAIEEDRKTRGTTPTRTTTCSPARPG